MGLKGNPWLFSFVVVYTVILSCQCAESLKIPFKSGSRVKRQLGSCEATAVCGTVQATSRGYTVSPLCSCPDPNDECPLVWDTADGRSVHQGSTQYKHCKESHSQHIPSCLPDQTAYTMKMLTPFLEDGEPDYDGMRISHKIHCTCPDDGHQHVQQDEALERIPFVGEIKTYTLSCAPYPTCSSDQACKTLSETKLQFLENEVCKCEQGLHCPVSGNRRAKSFEFGTGKITQLYCQ